jgi:hypothetical protein
MTAVSNRRTASYRPKLMSIWKWLPNELPYSLQRAALAFDDAEGLTQVRIKQ